MVLHSASLRIPEVVFTGKLYFAGIQRLHNLTISITFITYYKKPQVQLWGFLLS